MHKLDLSIARLKLLLAEVGGKRDALSATRHQYQEQIDRLISFTIHENASVDRSLAMVMDVDTRLQEFSRQEHYLEVIRATAQRELDSLRLTKLVEETRAQLALLQRRQREEESAEALVTGAAAIAAEIRRLEEIIATASGAAARSISAGT